MKKLIVVLAILSLTGIAFGAGIPLTVDPQNSPEVWTQEVYNGTATAITSGSTVVWDCDSVTTPAAYTDRCMQITNVSGADDIKVAGVVVDPSIPAMSPGTIAIYGPVYALCALATDNVTAVNHTLALSSVDGQLGQAGAATVDTGHLGWLISFTNNTAANGGYAGRVAITHSGVAATGTDWEMLPVFVNPGLE